MFNQDDFEKDFKDAEKRIRNNRRYIRSRARFIAAYAVGIFLAQIVALIVGVSLLVYLYMHYWK